MSYEESCSILSINSIYSIYKQSVVILKVLDINSCSIQKQLNPNDSNLYTAYIWCLYGVCI